MLRPLSASAAISVRNYHGSYTGEGTNAKRADPEPLIPVAAQIWTNQQVPPTPPKPVVNENDVLYHPLYTPPAQPDTSIGPLLKPLHFPEFDQRKAYWTKTGIKSYDSVLDLRYEDPNVSPIGNYPRIVPQFASLRDPYAYWDQQGRRNYGEILYDHDNFTDEWGIGHNQHYDGPLKQTITVLCILGGLMGLVYLWDPQSHARWAEKDYPFDGLRVMMGGDPNDESDAYMTANTYKI
eukprot:jgi/Hompol1/6081/HPOL_000612-RA